MAEYRFTEKPILDWLIDLGWVYLREEEVNAKRTLKPDLESVPNEEIYTERFLVRELYSALKRLNPIVIKTDKQCKVVIDKLKNVMQMSNLLDANEEFLKWLKGEKSIKFSAEEQAQTIKLIDLNPGQIGNNSFIVTNQFKIPKERELTKYNRNNVPDIVLFVNGIPIVIIEAKKTSFDPITKKPKITYVNAIEQLTRYQRQSPQLFVPNIFMVAVDSNIFKYATTGTTEIGYYFEWKECFEYSDNISKNQNVKIATYGLFQRSRFLDILENFIIYKTEGSTKFKIMARYNQYRAVNKIVDRVIDGSKKKGLIWHTQGSGKTFTMLFTALKLHNHPLLNKPTVFILIDRIKLDSQITKEFELTKIEDFVRATRKVKLMNLILNNDRKIIISTIHKFGNIWNTWIKKNIKVPIVVQKLINLFDSSEKDVESSDYSEYLQNIPESVIKNIIGKIEFLKKEKPEFLNEILIQKFNTFEQGLKNYSNYDVFSFSNSQNQNIIVLCDEAHRTQEGDIASEMNFELHSSYKFGFTGTPIDKKDRNTHTNFGIPIDAKGWERYLDYYSIKQSIEDGFTVPIRYTPRLDDDTRLNIPEDELEKRFANMTRRLTEEEREELRKKEGTRQVLMKHPERVKKIAKDIANHFDTYTNPEGFKAQIVVIDKKACGLIKKELDNYLDPEWSKVIFSVAQNENDPDILPHVPHNQDKVQQQLIIDNFKRKDQLPKILIVCDMLLTGFDAPIEQIMYLDKNLRDHALLQAISRTNRPYPNKEFGLIVGYTNVVQKLQEALNFDEEEKEDVAFDFSDLIPEFINKLQKVCEIFNNVDKKEYRNPNGTLNENDYACKLAEYLEDQNGAEEFFDDVKLLISQYESISPDPGLKLVQNQFKNLIYYYYFIYCFLNPSDPKNIEEFRPKTRKLIQESVNIGDIDYSLPIYIINENNLKLLNNGSISIASKALIFKTGLKARLNLNASKSKKFSHLGKKMDEIIEDIKNDALEGIEILNEMKKLEEEIIKLEKKVDESGPIKPLIESAFDISVEDKKVKQAGEKINELFQDIEDILINKIGEGWSKRYSLTKEFRKRCMILMKTKYKDLDLYNDTIIDNLVEQIKKEYP